MKLININFNNYDKIIFVSIFFISFFIFLFYVNLNEDINFYDELRYLIMSQKIRENGLFGWENQERTYLYPTILASIGSIFNAESEGISQGVYQGVYILNIDRITNKIIISVLKEMLEFG